MKHRLYINIYTVIFLLAAVGFGAHADNVLSEAGELRDIVGNRSVRQLTVTGTLNAADFDFIASELRDIETLDLSGATIEAYNGQLLSTGCSRSAANTLPEFALTGSPDKTVLLPSTHTSIDDGALAGSAITTLVIPQGVTTLGASFCNGCERLESVSFETSDVATLPAGAFKNCISLTSIELPQGVVTIDTDAMRGCKALTDLKLPESATTIGDRAFNGCTSLSTFNPVAGLSSIGEDAFSATALTGIDLSGCTRLLSIGGWAFAYCDALTEAILPASVTTIGDGLFFDCDKLARVVMPAGLTDLAAYMFKGTSLTDRIAIGEGVETIGKYALYGNEHITVLSLPSTIKMIDDKAMAGLSGLTRINDTGLTELPALGNEAFAGTAGSDVILSVGESMVQAFTAAPQWKEFNVIYDTSSIGEVTADDGSLDIAMKYNQNTLYITSSEAMTLISVFGPDGRALARQATGGSREAAVQLNRAPGSAVIVNIALSNGKSASFKTILTGQ